MTKEQFITINNEPEHLRETNQMQKDLMQRRCAYAKDQRACFDEWITLYSARFRKILEQEIRANPHLLRDITNLATRDAVLDSFERALYGDRIEDRFDTAA